MAVKMTALRTFEGTEGLVRRGDVFEVETQERADQLVKLQLAEEADSGAEVTNYDQRNAELDDMKKEELEKVAEDEGVTYRDGATKDEIRAAIMTQRENEYIKQQAQLTADNNTGARYTDTNDPTKDDSEQA